MYVAFFTGTAVRRLYRKESYRIVIIVCVRIFIVLH